MEYSKYLETPRDGLNISRVAKPASTAELLGYEGNLVECRLPTLGEPEWDNFKKRGGGAETSAYAYASRDGTEVISPTARDVIVPHPVDQEFLAYMRDMFATEPTLNSINVPDFTGQTVQEIMERYHESGGAKFYGWWAIDELNPRHQLVSPNAQRWGNEKSALRKIFAGTKGALAEQIILRDPRIEPNATDGADARTIFDANEEMLERLKNGSGQVWLKAAKWGLAGQGVQPGQTIEDVTRFYLHLRDLGIKDASVILEENLPGEGGSFTLIRRIDGKVIFSHVTKQLNVKGVRAGNIIHDLTAASPQMLNLINLAAENLGNASVVYPDKPGVYAFDTIEDAIGIPRANDVANRTTGTWTSAYHRIHLTNSLNLPRQDTVTGINKLYLTPNTSFQKMVRAFGDLTDWKNNGIVTIRQYFNGFGQTCAYLAYTTTDQNRLPSLQQETQDALAQAGIGYSPSKPL